MSQKQRIDQVVIFASGLTAVVGLEASARSVFSGDWGLFAWQMLSVLGFVALFVQTRRSARLGAAR